jgi:membrane protease YdiL (CAAX protease family)
MPSIPDLLLLASIAIAWPLYDYFVDWPRFLRWLDEGRRGARAKEYWLTLRRQWLLLAVGATLWHRAGRPWSALGLRAPEGWRLWVSAALLTLVAALNLSNALKVARSSSAKASVRKAIAPVEALVPHSGADFAWFVAVSVTAGVCEEFLFRGYFIHALAPWLGWWGAAALAVPPFGLLHAYQGRQGVVSTGIVGFLMTLVVAATRSLAPAMVLHALIDIGSGIVIWIALREEVPGGK